MTLAEVTKQLEKYGNTKEDFFMSYQFYVPTRTLFGAGKLNELHTQTIPGKKAMVVISNGKSMKETGTL